MKPTPEQILQAIKNTTRPVVNKSPQVFAAIQNEKNQLPAKETGFDASNNYQERSNYEPITI